MLSVVRFWGRGQRIGARANESGLGLANMGLGKRIGAGASKFGLLLANMQAGANEYGLGLTKRLWPLGLTYKGWGYRIGARMGLVNVDWGFKKRTWTNEKRLGWG